MDSRVLDFLKKHRISVSSVLLDNSTTHSAAMHFSHQDKPFNFFFLADKGTRKLQPLQPGKEVTASLVIGFSEEEFATFQAEGTMLLVTEGKAVANGWNIYLRKYPEKAKLKSDPDIVMLRFTPTWWRFMDLKKNRSSKSVQKNKL